MFSILSKFMSEHESNKNNCLPEIVLESESESKLESESESESELELESESDSESDSEIFKRNTIVINKIDNDNNENFIDEDIINKLIKDAEESEKEILNVSKNNYSIILKYPIDDTIYHLSDNMFVEKFELCSNGFLLIPPMANIIIFGDPKTQYNRLDINIDDPTSYIINNKNLIYNIYYHKNTEITYDNFIKKNKNRRFDIYYSEDDDISPICKPYGCKKKGKIENFKLKDGIKYIKNKDYYSSVEKINYDTTELPKLFEKDMLTEIKKNNNFTHESNFYLNLEKPTNSGIFHLDKPSIYYVNFGKICVHYLNDEYSKYLYYTVLPLVKNKNRKNK